MDVRGREGLTGRRAVVAGLVLVLVAATGWWFSTADDRRVDAACDTWLEHRDGLRSALRESDEAAERAQASATDVRDEFSDIDVVTGSIDGWSSVSPAVIGSLDGTTRHSGEDLEGNLTFFLGQVDQQLALLPEAIESGDGRRVAAETPEAAARFQVIDDLCLSAARGD